MQGLSGANDTPPGNLGSLESLRTGAPSAVSRADRAPPFRIPQSCRAAARPDTTRTLEGPMLSESGTRDAGDRIAITLTINGQRRQLQVAPWTSLLDLLREDLDLTGTKKGCDHGQCGACTVIVDGRRVNACLALAVMKDGASVTTIEGLSTGALHPVQAAFVEHDAFQCGYCTPGQIMSAVALIEEGRARTREEIREYMSGNLCRCGAYTNIVDAVESVLNGSSARREAAE
jgi:xanthine dehydrogenase YagT iron-sulfur-binding subunit